MELSLQIVESFFAFSVSFGELFDDINLICGF